MNGCQDFGSDVYNHCQVVQSAQSIVRKNFCLWSTTVFGWSIKPVVIVGSGSHIEPTNYHIKRFHSFVYAPPETKARPTLSQRQSVLINFPFDRDDRNLLHWRCSITIPLRVHLRPPYPTDGSMSSPIAYLPHAIIMSLHV